MAGPGYILIAEDDQDDQLLIRSAFREIGEKAELVFVENGLELVTYFGRHERGEIADLPSLVIVDLNMPKKNGREAMESLRDKPFLKNFPIVVFSTTGNEFERNRCLQLGFDNYFVKPANFSELVRIARQFSQLAHGTRVT